MTSAMIYDGRIVSYSDEGEGVMQAWCEGKEIRVDEQLRAAIEENETRMKEKHG